MSCEHDHDMATASSVVPKVKLFGAPYSTCTSRVIMCLMEKQVDYDLQVVDIAKTQDHKKPEFLAMQPFGMIPVLQDKDIQVFESRAIVRYIARKHEGHGTPLYGTSEKDRAMVEQWLEVEAQNYNPAIAPAVWHLVHAPLFGQQGDPAIAATSLQKLEKVLDVYEGVLSKSKYLAGDFFSLADLSHIPFTHYLINDGGKGEIYDKRPHVKAWWTSISTRPTWKKHLSNAFPGRTFP
ncbi:glutathione S-transferase [Marchantia polymorpha subsp. ruderalis]|uniref:glutathione transferase n=2 Tax=Marchantia polymorpha TaxID=3197 RepID=A0AAF6AUM3_MARPO|nr:hypothetical protein MARPO_0002s0202 [Marchantia polymorpha]PTQ49740.1 hypothetical protein MARPO_0002s0202 [Marchantia polymorpha]BBN00144.1 hypothetical protein Mp_1g26760 [Marchantia polymorpha subsp. ruderalis]BBN00145.1 hypothetical protein Mp_1g26760 [Marchantia polymorpha subsp. ruderalis]|eukprot:PTQ49739.1 hypothetical protein MARPO_0002s0202 [Marchantia polymorpha]